MSSSTKTDQSSEPPSLIPSLPDDIIMHILSRVRSCYHRTLSLVSKHFRSLVTSHALYEKRSSLECTERRLYVVLSNRETTYHNPYILCRQPNDNHRLVLTPWPTNVPHVGSFVTVGSKIYAFDMLQRYHYLPKPSIECRFQTVQLPPCMNATMDVSVAGVIDGKIYVIAYTKIPWDKSAKMVMAVFNTETQIWESATETMIGRPAGCVVMAGKMYARDLFNSFVYYPEEGKWETDKTLNMLKWVGGCVVDDVLYYYDTFRKVLRGYNPRESRWVVVKGLERLVAEARFSESSYAGSCGGKVALFFCKDRRIKVIRCAVISLERRHQGRSEIWGKIDWCDDVLFRSDDLFVTKTLDVIV